MAPPRCANCDQEGSLLCSFCWQEVELSYLPPKLKLPELFLDQVQTLCRYQPPISSLIRAMKYQSVKAVCDLVGMMLYYGLDFPPVDLVSWVPTSPGRIKKRGFNQAELIARQFARAAKLPCRPLLVKVKATQSQAGIKDRALRALAQEGGFGVKEASSAVKNKNILLVDDVITTGATLNQCAKVLKKAGAQTISAVCLAHESS
ncbi:MAG: hypothetical protein GF381_00030 [Candidatus Pacebacteria bacterium]|nr:hypothetical protein [Candidatus Paceibacterota bacterium]